MIVREPVSVFQPSEAATSTLTRTAVLARLPTRAVCTGVTWVGPNERNLAMKHAMSIIVLVLGTSMTVGCGGTGADSDAVIVARQNGPEHAVFRFLEAVRTGSVDQAEAVLTPLAKEKTRQLNMVVAPPGSDTASFRVGEVLKTAAQTAHVKSEWTDLDAQGQPKSDTITWIVRQIDGKWLISGMSASIFPGQPALVLNFEDPEDMIRQQELVEAQRRLRAEAATLEARKPDDPFQSGPQ